MVYSNLNRFNLVSGFQISLMATIRDVAQYAGVSVGTVSNVLNGSPLVKDKTRQRVLAAIEALNFTPSAAARSLITQRTNTIGMVRTELRPRDGHIESDPVILDLIDGVSSAAIDEGIGLTFWTIPVGAAEMDLYKRLVNSRQIDGLILFAVRQHDPRVAFLLEQDFPFVIFGRPNGFPTRNWVDVDGAYGIATAVQHAAQLGHRRIGYIAPPAEQFLSRYRWAGFVAGMQDAQLTIDPALVYEGDFSDQSGQIGAHMLLDADDPPTTIICNNDRMALGAMRAVQARGLNVGTDVSVIGFDNIALARFSSPPLTTLNQPTQEVGAALFQLLMALIDERPVEGLTERLFQPELIIRKSSGTPRAK